MYEDNLIELYIQIIRQLEEMNAALRETKGAINQQTMAIKEVSETIRRKGSW